MELNVSITEALEFVDELSCGQPVNENIPLIEVMCITLAEEVRRLQALSGKLALKIGTEPALLPCLCGAEAFWAKPLPKHGARIMCRNFDCHIEMNIGIDDRAVQNLAVEWNRVIGLRDNEHHNSIDDI